MCGGGGTDPGLGTTCAAERSVFSVSHCFALSSFSAADAAETPAAGRGGMIVGTFGGRSAASSGTALAGTLAESAGGGTERGVATEELGGGLEPNRPAVIAAAAGGRCEGRAVETGDATDTGDAWIPEGAFARSGAGGGAGNGSTRLAGAGAAGAGGSAEAVGAGGATALLGASPPVPFASSLAPS